MVGTPRLATLGIVNAAGRHLVNRLEAHFALYLVGILTEYFLTEVCLKILADNKDNLAKAGTQCIEDAVVHDGLAIRSQSVQLLQSSVTTAHTGSQNKQCRFHI